MQSTLYTQYSFSGSAAYSISEAVTLHAYGQYYANNPIVGPAFSPYVSTTTYGAYADIRFSDRFGSNIGVRRYINPMSGQWTTSPIVAAVWGDRDNPMRFRPQPQPQQHPKKK